MTKKIQISNFKFRIESDALGKIKVPQEAYYGSFTTRALAHFQISGLKAPATFRTALGWIKLAACQANSELKLLSTTQSKAIERATREFIDGKFDAEFQLDIFQAGAGTAYNMNTNEIIANRANELLKAPKGSYQFVHPNNHVNIGQSSNDVIPTATRLATAIAFQGLKKEMEETRIALEKKATEFKSIIKVGRTHLEDAVPMTLGQEFKAYASALKTAQKTIEEAEKALLEIGLGGTAIGSGINAHPQFQKTVLKTLSKCSDLRLRPAQNLFETTHSMAALLKASSALRALAVEVNRIANDLRLLNMGPQAGIAEIALPEVEPGSSIMPGKVNPSIAECMNMICFQVIANDQAVSLGAQGGQLELNWFTPLIAWNLLFSTQIMTNGLQMFREKCIVDIVANKKQIEKLFNHSLITATALTPALGYHKVALLVNEALKKRKPLREVVESKKWLMKKQLDEILDPKKMIGR